MRGAALAVPPVSRRRPRPEAAYRRRHRERAHNDSGLGAVQFVQVYTKGTTDSPPDTGSPQGGGRRGPAGRWRLRPVPAVRRAGRSPVGAGAASGSADRRRGSRPRR
ncbi:hypothetical protein FM076_31865 [Streptomyces albus subsp. chlorinus]|nr:hypothetical protein [Streptomyces albus subsp. chlorinus]